MARVTVEDCIDKVDSPYELVLVAKERATQLNSGIEPTLDRDNDKHTVIALREIAEETIKVPDLTEAAVYKLRKHVEQIDDTAEEDEDIGDDFENQLDFSPTSLSMSNSLTEALEIASDFVGESIPVVEEGSFIGAITEGDLFTEVLNIEESLREEEEVR